MVPSSRIETGSSPQKILISILSVSHTQGSHPLCVSEREGEMEKNVVAEMRTDDKTVVRHSATQHWEVNVYSKCSTHWLELKKMNLFGCLWIIITRLYFIFLSRPDKAMEDPGIKVSDQRILLAAGEALSISFQFSMEWIWPGLAKVCSRDDPWLLSLVSSQVQTLSQSNALAGHSKGK